MKVHMVANVANRLPHFCVFGKAKDHDSKMEDELFNSLKEGDIGIADRAYNCFKALYRQSRRGVFFVVREKSGMRYRVVKRVAKKDLGENILSDETIQLTGQRTSKEYPDAMRRVKARVKVDGKWRTMVFLTNNFEWSVSTIAELYNALGGTVPVRSYGGRRRTRRGDDACADRIVDLGPGGGDCKVGRNERRRANFRRSSGGEVTKTRQNAE